MSFMGMAPFGSLLAGRRGQRNRHSLDTRPPAGADLPGGRPVPSRSELKLIRPLILLIYIAKGTAVVADAQASTDMPAISLEVAEAAASDERPP